MAEPTDAPAEAPKAPESETQSTTNAEPTQAPEQKTEAPEMHGFTSEQLADMEKFFKANGGFEKVKSKISNPEKASESSQVASEPKNDNQPALQPEQPVEAPKTPQGAITAQEFLAEQYFKSLAGEEKYAPIAEGIRKGEYLKEMSAFGINALNQDGSINDQKVRMYLDLKAQTVPAKPTESEPNASTAPTVTYTEVGEGGITSLDQAYKILMENGNPAIGKAEEYIKNAFNPNSDKEQKK